MVEQANEGRPAAPGEHEVRLADALTQVQEALITIESQPSYNALGIKLTSADLNLVTKTVFGVNGEATVLVVTVAGALESTSTSSLNISLTPPGPEDDKKFKIAGPGAREQLEALSLAMLEVVGSAASAHGKPLLLKQGMVTVELVVDAGGSLKVATKSLLSSILERFGIKIGAELTVSANLVSTSSIVLTFERDN